MEPSLESYTHDEQHDAGVQLPQGTKRTLSGSRRSNLSVTSLPQSAAPSPAPGSAYLQLAQPIPEDVAEHIEALKKYHNDYILQLLDIARSQGQSYATESIPSLDDSSSIYSDPRFSQLSRDSCNGAQSHRSSGQIPTERPRYAVISEPCPHLTPRLHQYLCGRPSSLPATTRRIDARNQTSAPPRRPDSTSAKVVVSPPLDLQTEHAQTTSKGRKQAPKKYQCTFCEHYFAKKGNWILHEEEIHEKPRIWRCRDCNHEFPAQRRFQEHHRNLHRCEQCSNPSRSGPSGQRQSALVCSGVFVVETSKEKVWACGFCKQLFSSWKDRCEHIAYHFDKEELSMSEWDHSGVVLLLLSQDALARYWRIHLQNKDGHESSGWPTFSWDVRDVMALCSRLERGPTLESSEIWDIIRRTYDKATRSYPQHVPTFQQGSSSKYGPSPACITPVASSVPLHEQKSVCQQKDLPPLPPTAEEEGARPGSSSIPSRFQSTPASALNNSVRHHHMSTEYFAEEELPSPLFGNAEFRLNSSFSLDQDELLSMQEHLPSGQGLGEGL
ncbi:hypothetical protein BDY21DRAFT_189794 [Lineolata rhizophorae]|uniref:C2H2-type domain-containing protein n=1 Tax=Lineolata rhizophorae TaxID=578093 RepID=A0A6A6P5X2_9PEZI|nr:hypothetical protein BDY21DRAFT_189794 [Lineolata rhizophorae]